MNNVIELKGKKFGQSSKRSGGGGVSMNGHMSINHSHVNSLQKKMETIVTFWDNESRPFSGVLISVHYNKIVAKSNRIGGLFKGNKSNFAIVGAKFNDNKNRHIITYFLDATDLSKSIH